MNNNFTQKVLDIVSKIPKGKTMSYAQVAKNAGSKGAGRAVGSIMKKNFNQNVPCHRVICSNGKLGQYNRGGELRKKELLLSEGVVF